MPHRSGAPPGAVPLFRRYAGIVLDIDGVVLHLEQPVPNAPEAVAALRSEGIALAFVTNNATRTPKRSRRRCGPRASTPTRTRS